MTDTSTRPLLAAGLSARVPTQVQSCPCGTRADGRVVLVLVLVLMAVARKWFRNYCFFLPSFLSFFQSLKGKRVCGASVTHLTPQCVTNVPVACHAPWTPGAFGDGYYKNMINLAPYTIATVRPSMSS